MAVPDSVTIKNLSGTYLLNKQLSDSSQEVLKLQNVGFVVRQAVAWSSVTSSMDHATDNETGKVRIDTKQISTGGITNEEHWDLDGEEREAESKIWGKVKGYYRYTKLSEVEDLYLKEGWEQACVDGEVIEAFQASQTDTWTVQQVIGFAEVDGQRRQVRRVLTKKGDVEHRIRIVYDWKP